MKVHIEFTQAEIDAVKNIVTKYPADWRYQENVVGEAPVINDDTLWMAHLRGLLTTQQKSGAGSPINVFLDQKPFPLTLQSCLKINNLESIAFDLLTEAKGIRRTKKIAKAMQTNLTRLENGEWNNLRGWCDKLLEQRRQAPDPKHRKLEEEAADYMDSFLQFGPKQSRNFWQLLGLTRYVFVLDSRMIGWIRKNLELDKGLLTASGLGDREYYQFVSNLLYDLCRKADVLPCIFDGAVFSSYE